jgi:hypothetical protein
MIGRAAGALATGIENTGAAFAKIGEATPNILKELAPPAIGAVVAGDERRGEGAIVGALLGKAGKPALAALKYAAKTPALIRDIEEARVLSAGASKGTFETLASFPEVSENAAKILRFGGRRLDNTLNNVVEYAKAGVNPTLIALATGALDSASPEELNKLTSTGLLYGLGGRVVHQAWGKITGVDPVIDARNRRQQDIDDLKTYRDLDPETRKTLDSVTSWDNIVERHTQRAANAEQAYNDALALGKKDAEQLGKVAQAEKNILSAVTRANVQTRDENSRQFVTQLTKLNQLVNGTLRAGQNNVGINILTPEQIVAKFRSDPANATATDQEILEVASQRGFYSTPEGAVEYQAGMGMDAPMKKLVFDRTKPSVVINADSLKARTTIEGSTPIDALNHEVGHHVRNIPEFREVNKDAEELLFSQEVKDPAGNVVAVTAGQYSGKDLVDMYLNDYLKGKTPEQVTQISQLAGLWDYSRGALNEGAVSEYMKDEIISELNSETFSTHLGKGLDDGVLHMIDVARLKTKKNLLDRAVQKFFGLGGKGEATSELTGATFSPEVLAANRQAMRALQSLQGEVSQAVTSVESPKISRSEIIKNKAIRERFAKYAGLFKTKMQGQVFDGNGNPIGAPIDIANPNASEGSWESRNGETKQLNGYGARPDEVAETAGVVIPDGGRLVVQKQIVTQPDGVTPVMMTPKEAKDLQKNRAEVIRQSLNTPDEGAPNRFEAVNDESETWRGTFTPLQIQAIKDMPEGIIPKSIKEHALRINEMIARGDGGRLLVDYAAVMNDAGKYVAFSPKIYDVVPIGMHLSKAGNFLVTTISVGRMFDKLNAWSERMPARLAPWGGSKDAFFKEFTEKYLQNWQNGLAGETGLSGDRAEALAKKDIFNDFLNLTTNDFRGANMDRTTTPRRRGDARGKNIDRTIMSMRLDHMAELMDNDNAPKVPIDYGKAIKNFMPAEGTEPAPAQEERRPVENALGITATYSPESRPLGAQYVIPSGAELTASLVASGTSLESFGKETLTQLAESYGIELPKDAKRGEIIDAINDRPIQAPVVEKPAIMPEIIKGIDDTNLVPTPKTGNQAIQGISKKYVESAGIPHNPHQTTVPVNEEMAKRIADYYQQQQDSPNDPAVKKAYTTLAKEVVDQWKAFEEDGYTAEPWAKEGQPYANSSEMMQDVRNNKHIYYFTTESGYGESGITDQMRKQNPMLASSGVDFGSAKNVPANDVFRVVHDIVGHGANGYEFGPKGEFNAYLEHSRMFSQDAKPALAAETLAQNSWVNYGPHLRDQSGNIPKKGEAGYVAVTERPFAEQKNIIIPKEILDEVDRYSQEQKTIQQGGISFMPAKDEKQEVQFKSKPKEGSVSGRTFDLVHFGSYGLKKTSPKKMGKAYATKTDLSGIDKTYFYVNGTDYESQISGGNPYTAKVDGNSIYDLSIDPLGVTGTMNRLKMEEAIQDAGYAGYFSPKEWSGAGFDAVAMFKDVNVTEAEPADIYSKRKLAAINKGKKTSEAPDYAAADAAWEQRMRGMQFMPSSKLDEEYAKSIRFDADPKEARKIVDQAAEKAGYDSSRYWYHGTAGDEFFVPKGRRGVAAHVSLNKDEAWNFAEQAENELEDGGKLNVREWYLKKGELFDPTNEDHLKKVSDSIEPTRESIRNQPLSGQWALKDDTYNPKTWKDKIWDFFEDSEIQKFIKDAGFIGYMDRESPRTPWEDTENAAIFDPNSLKEASLITLDDNRNIIPLSQRFDTSKQDIRFMPSSKLDEAYASAIKSGDMEEAQRLVDEKAREAGNPIRVYRSNQGQINQFDTENRSAWFTAGKEDAEDYASGKVSSYFIDPKNFASLDDPKISERVLNLVDGGDVDDLVAVTEAMPAIRKELSKDYDGVRVTSYGMGEPIEHYNPFESSQIKSADHATYDNEGNLIPLSQRFDLSKQDIRFMPSSKVDETYAKAIESGDMEEAQRLVDERAREAGYTIGPVYHGTNKEFNTLKEGRTPSVWATFDPNEAEWYADRKSEDEGEPTIKKWYAKGDIFDPRNPEHIDALKTQIGDQFGDDGRKTSELGEKGDYRDIEWTEVLQGIKKAGFDGYFDREHEDADWGGTIAVFDINSIKSADPATYDDEGKLIPLSQRFNPESNDIRFMPKSEEPEITEEGHVMPKTMDKPFAFTPQVAINFMPATEQVNLEDYLDRPIIALAADRMGIGQAYVGPTGAKQPLSMESQGGAGFSTLYRDEEHNPIWAFSKEQPALNFLKRINDVAEEYGVDSVLVAPTLLASDNHLKNQTGQLGYVEAMEAAMKAKMIKPSALNAQINEIIKRIAESDSPKAKQTAKRLEGISTFAEFADAVREQSFNFSDAEWLMKKAAQKKLPITAKELDQMGLLPSQIAKDLAHEGFYELPNFSVVSLFEVPKKQKPEKGMYHNAYPYIVRGKSIGYLKNIINLSQATKDPKVFNKGQIQSQPLMTVMPIIDKVLVKKALETLKAYTTPSK